MNKLDENSGLKRREFIKKTFKFATAAAFIGYGGLDLFAFPSFKNAIKTVTLNNGLQMPILGFGTMDLRDALGVKCVAEAISVGYRLIDTATIYANEEAVGKGIKQSGIKREELFVTSKLWVDDMGYENTKKAFYTTLSKLGTDYLDLYLIHRPRGDFKGSWKAMEELYSEGKIKAIGVSNFENHHLDDLIANSKIKPAINQIESHAFFQEEKAHESLNKYGIQMEAWAPFAEGRNSLFVNKTLAAIGKKYNKTNAQVSLRWLYQRGIVAIPRTTKIEHMIENLQIFDFELNKEDMGAIATLDLNKTHFPEWT